MSEEKGRVSKIAGPVVDVAFPLDALPELNYALEVDVEVDGETNTIVLEVAQHLGEGKIRAIGLSNETSWGTMQFLKIAKQNNLPKIVSIQNEYSLLCRHFDLDMAEVCHHENIGLLSFSPLACGILSGKYLDNKVPKGSRKSVYEN